METSSWILQVFSSTDTILVSKTCSALGIDENRDLGHFLLVYNSELVCDRVKGVCDVFWDLKHNRLDVRVFFGRDIFLLASELLFVRGLPLECGVYGVEFDVVDDFDVFCVYVVVFGLLEWGQFFLRRRDLKIFDRIQISSW